MSEPFEPDDFEIREADDPDWTGLEVWLVTDDREKRVYVQKKLKGLDMDPLSRKMLSELDSVGDFMDAFQQKAKDISREEGLDYGKSEYRYDPEGDSR